MQPWYVVKSEYFLIVPAPVLSVLGHALVRHAQLLSATMTAQKRLKSNSFTYWKVCKGSSDTHTSEEVHIFPVLNTFKNTLHT